MKKYLIKGLLALVVGGFVASCADDKVDYIPISQQKATAYEDAFKELIGGEVAPNHDWGFKKTSIIEQPSEARANTRGSEPNSAVWSDYGYPEKPGTLKETTPSGKSEEEIVTEWFQNHTIADAVTLDCNNYWVLQVHYKNYDYTANQHEWEKYENDQEVWKTSTTPVNPLGHMDQIFANKNADGTSSDHIYNFNTGSGSYMLVINSETQYGFGYEESWGTSDNHVYNRSFMAHIVDEANGIDGYYVGFDYQAYKRSNVQYTNSNGETIYYNNNKDWALEPDGVYDDRIIKIVPGTAAREISNTTGGGTSSSSTATRTDRVERRRIVAQGRIFCEDLGTNEITTSDIDFNDAVFDAKIWKVGQFNVTYVNGNYSSETDYLTDVYDYGIDDDGTENGKFRYIAEICLLAAGGTVPLKIGGNDGFEIHSKFGEGNGRNILHTTIINTMGAPSQRNFTTTVNTEKCNAVTAEIDITSLVKGKSAIGLDIIPIEVQWVRGDRNQVGELDANFGEAPQKLCVPIGTPWVYERIPVTDAYKDFSNYATNYTTDNNLTFWASDNKIDPDMLYPSKPVGMTAEAVCETTFTGNSYHDKTITTGTTTTTTTDILVLAEETHEFPGESTQGVTVNIFNKDLHAGDVIRVTGSNTGSDPHSLEVALIPSDSEVWSTRLYNTTVDFTSGTITFEVTQEVVDALPASKQAFGVWGRNITVTKFERIRTTRSSN